uniref:Uncharacterized protein n=1 Tax=Oryza brachyantha TaxID=4533 RepID=J3MVT4_ORYBR
MYALIQIDTEQLLAHLVEAEMNRQTVLGHICMHILASGLNGYMAFATNLKEPTNKWRTNDLNRSNLAMSSSKFYHALDGKTEGNSGILPTPTPTSSVATSSPRSICTSSLGHVSYMGQKPMGRGEWVANGLKIVQQKGLRIFISKIQILVSDDLLGRVFSIDFYMAFQTITKVNVSNDSSVLTSLDAQGHVSYMGQKPMGRGEWVANGLKIVQQKATYFEANAAGITSFVHHFHPEIPINDERVD